MFVVNGQVDLNDPELEEPDLVSIGSDVSVNHARICAAGRPTTERDREREREVGKPETASQRAAGREIEGELRLRFCLHVCLSVYLPHDLFVRSYFLHI